VLIYFLELAQQILRFESQDTSFVLRLIDETEDTRHDRSMLQLKPLHESTIRTTHFCARGQIQP